MNNTLDTLKFPLKPWRVEGEKDAHVLPVPGTWTLAPEAVWEQGIKGIVCCPNRECQQAALIRYDMGKLDNGVLELDAFRCAKCLAEFNVRLLQWDTRKLYCVAYELLRSNGDVDLRKEYLHAESRHDAIACLVTGTGYQLDKAEIVWRLVDAAPVIGFFGQESDKTETKLSVD